LLRDLVLLFRGRGSDITLLSSPLRITNLNLVACSLEPGIRIILVHSSDHLNLEITRQIYLLLTMRQGMIALTPTS
jgi:hypothetical protein